MNKKEKKYYEQNRVIEFDAFIPWKWWAIVATIVHWIHCKMGEQKSSCTACTHEQSFISRNVNIKLNIGLNDGGTRPKCLWRYEANIQ